MKYSKTDITNVCRCTGRFLVLAFQGQRGGTVSGICDGHGCIISSEGRVVDGAGRCGIAAGRCCKTGWRCQGSKELLNLLKTAL